MTISLTKAGNTEGGLGARFGGPVGLVVEMNFGFLNRSQYLGCRFGSHVSVCLLCIEGS